MSVPATIARLGCRVVAVNEATHWTFIEVECSDGVVGLGEASLNNLAPVLRSHADVLSSVLLGRTAVPNAARGHLPENRGGLAESAVLSSVEQALWDAQGRRLGVPVVDLLGGALRERVPVYANINRGTVDRTPDGFATSAHRAVDEGFRFVKIAPFQGVGSGRPLEEATLFEAGLQRIERVCAAVAGRAQVLVDCHWRLDEPQAAQLLEFAARHGLYWIECPVPERFDQLPTLRRLRNLASRLGVRLAGMEKGLCLGDFQPYIQEKLYDVLMPDVKYCGGLAAMISIAEAADAAGILIAPHNPTGPVCHAASIALSAAIPNLLFLELQYNESPLFKTLVRGGSDALDGSVAVSRAAGFGVALAPEVLAEAEIA